MGKIIRRVISEPRRDGLSTELLWKGDDQGLIVSWEVGRDLAKADPKLAERVKRGELPILSWKGGVAKKLKSGKKHGTLRYLAMLQGLRSEDLHIDTGQETELVCSRTGVTVTYTADASKYRDP